MEEKKIKVNGLEAHFIIGSGEKGPVLILHGWGSRSERWQKTAEILEQNNVAVVVPDLPGFGASQEPVKPWSLADYVSFVDAFAKTIGLSSFYLLGHSFGGQLAAKYALSFPSKVKSLFLVAAACLRKKTFRKQLLLGVSKLFGYFSFLPFYSLFRRAAYKFFIKSDYLYTKGVMRETYLNVIKEDLAELLPKIKKPTTIIWGDSDDVTPIDQAQLINSKIKSSKLVIIKGQNHDIERQAPEILARRILENL